MRQIYIIGLNTIAAKPLISAIKTCKFVTKIKTTKFLIDRIAKVSVVPYIDFNYPKKELSTILINNRHIWNRFTKS